MLSNNPEFRELLLLHGRDRRLGKLEEELNLLPEDIIRIEQKISIENESIELAVSEWKLLETNNTSLEKEIIEIGEKIAKSKTRQLEVKKNEEYQALENEIASLATIQSEKEDEQIEILVKIDDDVYWRPGPLLDGLKYKSLVGYVWGFFDYISPV